MVLEVSMCHPLCLIENTLEGELRVRQDALKVLSEIQEPMVVVTIVGLYRTGKSYLMNRLAGTNRGFSIGPTVQSHTKGIWMWCMPHPEKSNYTLLLLDTEGLGDVEKGDSTNENWIFALAELLSSTFVYNSMGTIDQRALEQLHYATELSKHIKMKSSQGSNSENTVDDFFPTFIWTVRDFTLDLELGGRQISADDYLENALQPIKGNSDKVSSLNLPRECIRASFPVRKCFVFDRPSRKGNLKKLEELPEEHLEHDFVEQANMFCQYIFKECKPKTIQGGDFVTGKILAKLAMTFVDTISRGTIPCIGDTISALSTIENSAAVQEAATHYEKQMRQHGKFPTETVECFHHLHAACEREAINIFMDRSFMDANNKYEMELKGLLKTKKAQLCVENEQISMEHCRTLLQQLFIPIQQNISGGCYSMPGGYQLFQLDQKKITEDYIKTSGKGVKENEALQEFLKSKESVARTILKMDQTLTAIQQQIAAEQARAKAIEEERKRQEILAKQRAHEESIRQQRAHEEHIRQLKQKMEEDRLNQQRENDRRIQQQLEEQQARLQQEALRREQQQKAELERLSQQIMYRTHSRNDGDCAIL
ncbi:guanylate-binding protein 1-like isoform X1 [Pleurodeles waltl]